MDISDLDRAAMAATALGEARDQGFEGMAAVADVIMNRAESDRNFLGGKNPTPASIAMAGRGSQYNNWMPGNANYGLSLRAAFKPETLTPAERKTLTEAYRAVDAVVSGPYRGITQGATYYSNPRHISEARAREHAKEGLYNGKVIGDHVFYGREFNPQASFDLEAARIAHAVGVPEYSEAIPDIPGLDPIDYGGFIDPVPSGVVNIGQVPDIADFGDFANKSFSQPASAGFSLPDDFGLGMPDPPDYAAMESEFRGINTDARLADMRTSAYDQGFYGQQPMDDMPDIMGQFDQGTYPDITAGLHDAYPSHGVGQPAEYGEEQAWGNYTPSGPGFHSGFDGWTPAEAYGPHMGEFDQAGALAARTAQDRISAFESGHLPGISYGNIDQLNENLMSELGSYTQNAEWGFDTPRERNAPSFRTETYTKTVPETYTPKAAPQPAYDMQAAYMGDWEDKLGKPTAFQPSVSPQAKPKTATRMVEKTFTRQVPVQAPVVKPSIPMVKPVALPPAIEIPDVPLSSSFSSLPSSPYSGYANATDAMNAIGSGMAPMPGGINSAWGNNAFSDSVYAGAAYNDVMDAVAKEGGFAPREGIFSGLMNDMGFGSPPAASKPSMGGITDLFGATNLGPFSFGGVNMPGFSLPDISSLFGGDTGYGGSGRTGDTYSNDRGFSDPGGWGLGNIGNLGGFMDGSIYGGGGGGGFGGGGMNSNGGYGNADGSASNNGPGIW